MTDSLRRVWKNALVLDWISQDKAKTLTLEEFYVGLRWTERKKTLENYKVKLTNIYDIFTIVPSDKPQSIKIFIEGKKTMFL